MTNPTTLTYAQTATLISEIQNFQAALNAGTQALRNVISTGTILYDDPNFAIQFVNTYQAYETWMITVQNAINTLFASIPVQPTL